MYLLYKDYAQCHYTLTLFFATLYLYSQRGERVHDQHRSTPKKPAKTGSGRPIRNNVHLPWCRNARWWYHRPGLGISGHRRGRNRAERQSNIGRSKRL